LQKFGAVGETVFCWHNYPILRKVFSNDFSHFFVQEGRGIVIQLLQYYWSQGYKSDSTILGQALVKMVLDNEEISYAVSLTLNLKYMQLLQEHMKIYPGKNAV